MGKMVEFASNGKQATGYLAVPETSRGAAVVVIQEWWGLVPHIKDVADRFAAAGFVALAPDLFDGTKTTEPDEAGKLMMAIELPRAAKELTGAVSHLSSLEATSGHGVGVVGFCMGGGLALWLSTLSPDVKACVPFYGAIPWPDLQPDYSHSVADYLGHYAEHDDWASQAVARKLESDLRAQKREATVHIYPKTEHAFFNDSRPEVYAPEASALAWQRTIDFLRQKL